MEIQDIVWLDVFTEKLWRKHRVLTEEVEEALYSSPKIRFIEKGDNHQLKGYDQNGAKIL